MDDAVLSSFVGLTVFSAKLVDVQLCGLVEKESVSSIIGEGVVLDKIMRDDKSSW